MVTACSNQDAEEISNVAADFQPSKLASVQVAEDYEVNFWEIAPGEIVIDRYRSIEAEKNAPSELKTLSSSNDYVSLYKKLAGPQFDRAAIERLALAGERARNPLPKQWTNVNKEGMFLETMHDGRIAESTALRVAAPVIQPRCSPDFNANSPDPQMRNFQALWFYNNFVIDPVTGNEAAYDHELNTPPMSVPISTVSAMVFDLEVMNGQYWEQDYPPNVVRATFTSTFNGTINPQRIRTFTIPPGRAGTFRVEFEVPFLTCPTTHFAVYWVNLIKT